MRVLHICSDFAKQSIYNQLVSQLDSNHIDQTVFVPVRTPNELNKYRNLVLFRTKYEYAHILNKFDRFNFYGKIAKTTKYLTKIIDQKLPDITHAHFLFSDGGVALNLYQNHGIPYIVAVRNTDLNIFFKYFIHLRKKGIEILLNAQKIIFLSSAYQKTLIEQYIPNRHKAAVACKSIVLPNGVDSFWLKEIPILKKVDSLRVLYVGDFTSNKNIPLTIAAIKILRNKGHKIEFDIVGGGGNDEKKIISESKNFDWIHLYPRTNRKEELKRFYEKATVFAMPSKYETFGLVYIEAMSQGCPVLFTKGQGIDGYFNDGEIGYGVEPNDALDLSSKILMAISNFDSLSNNCIKFAKNFSWEIISKKYIEIYHLNYETK